MRIDLNESFEADLMHSGWTPCEECNGTGLIFPGPRSFPQVCLCGGRGEVFSGVDPENYPSFYGLEWDDLLDDFTFDPNREEF